MNTIIKWYYKTKLFLKPRIWPFCRVKGCWEKNCTFAGIRVTVCNEHAYEKMLEALGEEFATRLSRVNKALEEFNLDGPETWDDFYSRKDEYDVN